MIYKIALRQAMGAPFTRKWSNTYYVDAANITEALDFGIDLWNNYQSNFTSEGVYCYEIYANLHTDPPGSPGGTRPVPPGDQRGDLAGWNAAAALPLFNVVRVDFFVPNSRPSRKFYRPGLQEGSIENGALFPTYATDIQAWCQQMALLPYTIDVDGQKWASAIVKGITSRRLGRDSGVDVPVGPAFG